jgi:hypothetical protein
VVSELGKGDGTLAQADEGLVDDAGQPVRAGWAGQLGAGPGPPPGGDAAQLVTHRCRGGDQHRGQRGAGGLGGIHGVITAGHQQPHDLPVTVGAHLRLVRAGQQLTGRADSVDRVALGRAAAACVPPTPPAAPPLRSPPTDAAGHIPQP